MFFKISRSSFLKAILNVNRVIVSNSPLPVFQGIKLEIFDDYIKLTGSDSDISLETVLYARNIENKLDITETGALVIESRYLTDIIRKLDGEVVTVELIDGTLVKIYDENTDYKINGTKANKYPLIDFSKPDLDFEMSTELFSEILNQTIFATSSKETRPVLTGVNFNYQTETGEIVVIATDSHRLTQKKLEFTDIDKSFNITVPKKALTELLSLLEREESVVIALNEKKIQFILSDLVIQSKLLDGVFPETKRLIPTEFITEILIGTKQLLGALERASFIRQEGTTAVRVDIDQDKMVMSNTVTEIGSFNEGLAVQSFSGNPLVTSFNYRYMIESLKSLNCQDVLIKFSGETRPFLVLNPNDTSIIDLILPIRTYY